jgi:hypothetical protein
MPDTLRTVWGLFVAGRDGGPVPALFDGQVVCAALAAIDEALEQALTARTGQGRGAPCQRDPM